MIEELKAFTETIVKSLVSEPDLVKVQNFQDEEENPIIEYQYTEEYIQYKNGESIFKEKSRLNSMVSISNVEKK